MFLYNYLVIILLVNDISNEYLNKELTNTDFGAYILPHFRI